MVVVLVRTFENKVLAKLPPLHLSGLGTGVVS
jgi:hypothetical protein